MKKGLLFLSIFFFSIYAAIGQIPAGYYDSVDGLTGDALKTELNNIIDGHTELSYTAVKEALKVTDEDTLNSSNIICFYTGWSYGKDDFDTGTYGWNREHVWSKSHGDFGDNPPEGTDIHQLRPTDESVNSAKNNRDFDIGVTQYIDNSGPTQCYTDSDIWEPRDEVKGDVARIIFYMATRYEGENGEKDLEVVDYVDAAPLKEPLYGKLSTLLQWHINDPVDDWEIDRNNIVYNTYQGNRNPYVDHPEYVNSIWGSTNPEPSNHVLAFNAGNPTPTSITLTWDDNQGVNSADKFYVMINTTGVFTPPIDGVENSDDTDISDGNGHVNVSSGVETYTFIGLNSVTTYYFEIFPFSNFGTDIDYKTDGTIPNSSESTLLTGTVNQNLIISEVADPADIYQARFVELYNAGSSSIDFGSETWYLCRQANGGNWGDIVLTGSVNVGETYVVAYSSTYFPSNFLFEANKYSGNISGNGNDGYFLFEGGNHSTGNLVDSYGVIDEDGTGEQWEYLDSKVVRYSFVTSPNAAWTASEWKITGSSDIVDMTPSEHNDDIYWVGSVDSDWHTKGNNWGGHGYVPDVSHNVIIPVVTNAPVITSVAVANSVTMQDNSVLTIDVGGELTIYGDLSMPSSKAPDAVADFTIKSDVLGNGSLIVDGLAGEAVTVEKYISGYTGNDDGWHQIGSPVGNMNIVGSDFDPDDNDDLFKWDEENYIWNNYKTTWTSQQFNSGEGYLVAFQLSGVRNFVGQMNNADQQISNLTVTSGKGEGWHFLGNPYPSAIEWGTADWALSNVGGVAQKWDDVSGNYAPINAGDIIPSTNGYFVQASASNNSITIPASARVHDTENNFISENNSNLDNSLLLRVTNDENGYYDVTYIRFRDDATEAWDIEFDAHKLYGASTAPQLWTVSDNDYFSQNCLPGINESNQLPLYFRAGANTTQHLLVEGIDSFYLSNDVFLEDLITNEIIDLHDQQLYDFTANVVDNENRFIIHFNDVSSTDEKPKLNEINIYSDQNTIYIKSNQFPDREYEVVVINLLGQPVYNGSIQPATLSSIKLDDQHGIFLVKVVANGIIYVNKVVLN